MACFCEHGDEPKRIMKAGNFLTSYVSVISSRSTVRLVNALCLTQIYVIKLSRVTGSYVVSLSHIFTHEIVK
jgi:hypothetical protein